MCDITKLCNLSMHDSQSNSELIYFDVDTLTAIIINSVEQWNNRFITRHDQLLGSGIIQTVNS